MHPVGPQIARDFPTPSGPPTRPAPTQPTHPAPAFDVAAARAEYARLQGEADLHARTAAVLLRERARSQRREWAFRQLAEPGAEELVAAQRDRTAKALVDLGDTLSAGPSPLGPAQAAEAYREAAEKFPASRQAQVARRKLEQIRT
jgi:hypothetical protein